MTRSARSPLILVIAAGAALAGCSSGFTNIAPEPPQQQTRLGKASGSACGSLGLFGTATNFVPMALNSRVERAYGEAVASVPGATALTDITMKEDWVWWLVGTSRCVTINGEAIK